MSARLEAAAKAISQRSVKPVEWDASNLVAYRFNRIYDAKIILGAADEVMFSDAAVEHAAVMLYEAAPYVRTLQGNRAVHWYSLSEDQKKLARTQTHAVITALKGAA